MIVWAVPQAAGGEIETVALGLLRWGWLLI